MNLLKKIQNKPQSTRYLILIFSVSFVMIFIIYFWFISFDSYFNNLSKGNIIEGRNSKSAKNLELLSLKDSFKASISDFMEFFSDVKNDINLDNQLKNFDNLENNQNQNEAILKFPDNY